jgi:hypothetical protein
VVAQWGTRKSARSAAATGSTIPAALDGNFDVQVKVTSSPGGGWTGPTTGQHWSDRWYADAACSLDDCALTLNGAVRSNIDFQGGEFTMPLHHSGGGYAGSVKALVTYCGTTANSSAETDTITVSLAPRRGTPRDTAWTSWTGTMVLSAPVTSVAAGSCPAATWTYAVAGGAA